MSVCSSARLRSGLTIPMLGLAACATGVPARPAPAPVRTSVHVEPQAPLAASYPVASTPGDKHAPLAPPQLSPERQLALTPAAERRIKFLEVQPGTPISQAVAQVAEQFGMGLSIDPAVRGTTSGTLRNVTLDSALTELVARRGYAYQVQGAVLRVVPIRMESRTFTLDYVALSRMGSMSTIVQRRLSSTATGIGYQPGGGAPGLSPQGGGSNPLNAAIGGDVLTGQSVADIWQEIRVALTGILQTGQSGGRVAGQEPAGNASLQTPDGTYSSGASHAQFPDGSSLVITPVAGLINVTAMPDKLLQVERFIASFQASVLRQVMIEAKIVEVRLLDSFKFGIDWSVITSSGNFGFVLRSDPKVITTGNAGNVNFTLSGGSTQITAVLNALATQGHVNVLSNEKTSALNNQRAIFNVTTDEVFFSVTRTPLLGPSGGVISVENSIIPQQIAVGVVLDVLAQISADNVLTMNVRPAVTNIDHIETITLADGTSSSAPAIARREGDTIARIRAGETMVIGGLVQTRKDRVRGGIPYLKDIPLLGKLFQRIEDTNDRSELVIFLTPTILSGAPAGGGSGGGGGR